MVISSILLIGIAMQSTQARATPLWAEQALSSKSAVASLRTHHRGSASPASTDGKSHGQIGVTSADPLIDPESQRLVKEMNRTLSMVGYLAATGDMKGALQSIEFLRKTMPDEQRTFVTATISLEYLTGDTKQAYADAVREFSQPALGTDRPWLELAAVCAANGQVFAGQSEYCEQAVRDGLAVDSIRLSRPVFDRSPRSAKEVETAACVALGIGGGSAFHVAFLERARSLDASNVAIAQLLVVHYEYSGQYSKGRRVATRMLSKCPTASDRQWFDDALKSDLSRPDKPRLRPIERADGP